MKCLNKTWRTATSCPKLNIEEIDVNICTNASCRSKNKHEIYNY